MHKTSPTLSIVVIAYNMPNQLKNTIITLSSTYQRGVKESDYEVIILENESQNCLPDSAINSLPKNFSYILRRGENSQSPVNAINEGLQLVSGEFVGLMVDGAHMLSPGVIKYALMAFTISKSAFVTVPVYHIGSDEQHISSSQGYDENTEEKLLDSINWQTHGESLFAISTRCSANPRGYFAPIMESNCYFSARKNFEIIGFADADFTLPGGGSINLHMTRQLGTLPGSHLFTLAGEGSFHQFHGGITSNKLRSEVVESHFTQLHKKWQGQFNFLAKNPTILGTFPVETHKELQNSSKLMERRFRNCANQHWDVWPDDIH